MALTFGNRRRNVLLDAFWIDMFVLRANLCLTQAHLTAQV
jgi:hypothetical protein